MVNVNEYEEEPEGVPNIVDVEELDDTPNTPDMEELEVTPQSDTPNMVDSEESTPNVVDSEESTPNMVDSEEPTPNMVDSEESTPNMVDSEESTSNMVDSEESTLNMQENASEYVTSRTLYALYQELCELRLLDSERKPLPEVTETQLVYETYKQTVDEAEATCSNLHTGLTDFDETNADNTLVIGCESGSNLVKIKNDSDAILGMINEKTFKAPEFNAQYEVDEYFLNVIKETDELIQNINELRQFLTETEPTDDSVTSPSSTVSSFSSEKIIASSPI